MVAEDLALVACSLDRIGGGPPGMVVQLRPSPVVPGTVLLGFRVE